jgi:hypothetical protein
MIDKSDKKTERKKDRKTDRKTERQKDRKTDSFKKSIDSSQIVIMNPNFKRFNSDCGSQSWPIFKGFK